MLIDKTPDLREAVLNLPEKEKDKLLLKLISKDVILLNQLSHKLLEGESDIDERVEIIKNEIDKKMKYISNYIQNGYNYSPGYFMMDLREMSGLINEHLLVTKHKSSEVDLRIYLLASAIECSAKPRFLKKTKGNEKLIGYFSGRIKYVLGKYTRLHDDIQFDFKDRLNYILNFAFEANIEY